MEFPFQINSFGNPSEQSFVHMAREQCNQLSHQLEGKRWQSQKTYLILRKIKLPILPGNWFHLTEEFQSPLWLSFWRAGERKPVITVRPPCYQAREGFRVFLPWAITGEAGQGGRKGRGESRVLVLSPWERTPKAASTMEKRSEVLGSPLAFHYMDRIGWSFCLPHSSLQGDDLPGES